MVSWKAILLIPIGMFGLFVFSIIAGMAVVSLGIDPYAQDTLIAVGTVFFVVLMAFFYLMERSLQ